MQPQTHFVDVPGGQIAYDETGGSGPLIVCTPGIGDRRQLYCLLRPALATSYRVATMDLRGHGDSSTGWPTYSAAALGSDILALIRHLNSISAGPTHRGTTHPGTSQQDTAQQDTTDPGTTQQRTTQQDTTDPGTPRSSAEPAIVITESITSASAVWAAAEAPELIAGLVLCGPAGTGLPPSISQRILMKAGAEIAGRFRWAWMAYWSSLFKARKPDDFAEYKKALAAMLAEPGRMAALNGMLRELTAGTADECNARMAEVRCPVLVVMGSKDPDSRDPAAQAASIAASLHGRAVVIEGAGRYPMAEFPDRVAAEILPFLNQVTGA